MDLFCRIFEPDSTIIAYSPGKSDELDKLMENVVIDYSDISATHFKEIYFWDSTELDLELKLNDYLVGVEFRDELKVWLSQQLIWDGLSEIYGA